MKSNIVSDKAPERYAEADVKKAACLFDKPLSF